jgi:hypothetical protein
MPQHLDWITRISNSNPNPYEAPSDLSILAASRPRYSLSAIVFLLFSLPVHLYFLAMFAAWTWYWIDGSSVPKTEKEFVAYACAFLCFITSGLAMMGVVLRRRKVQFISALLCVSSFLVIVVVL